jgi:hypothetical protein
MPPKRLPDEEQLSSLSIRIPVSLREKIEHSARRNRRSLNQEVIFWLERSAQEFGTPEVRLPAATAQSPQTSSRSSVMPRRELQIGAAISDRPPA